MNKIPKDPNTVLLRLRGMPKSLPEKWEKLYRKRYTQVSSYYRKKGLPSPLLEILIERFAFISCYILYLESPDCEKEDGNILSAKNIENYMALQAALNKQMDQINRQLGIKESSGDTGPPESKRQQNKKPSLTKGGIKELSDGKINKRISDLVRKGKGGAGTSAD